MAEESPNPVGRPPEPFDQVVADAICDLIIEGKPLRNILDGHFNAEDEDGRTIQFPTVRVFFRWLREYEDFRKQYAEAKEAAADAKLEELDQIGEEAIADAYKADPRAAGAVVQAHKLKADNMKWYMSKLKPKKYGEKLDLTSGGERIKQAPAIISTIKPRNTDAETEAETAASS